MFANYYADMLVTLMLGWTRGLMDWIWNIINLGDGSGGRRFLFWFSANWTKLVVLMLLIGIALDWFIWMIRWRPYWLWFGKKRRILNDTHNTARVDKAPRPERSRRPEGPHYTSKALPRAHIAQSHADFEEDELFDVVSSAIPQPAAPVQPQLVHASVNRYIGSEARDTSSRPNKEKSKIDEIEWFD